MCNHAGCGVGMGGAEREGVDLGVCVGHASKVLGIWRGAVCGAGSAA